MRGPVNTTIRLKIVRKGQDKPIELAITRDTITVRAVRTLPEGDVGYIRITQFTEQTSDGLRSGLETLARQIPADKLMGYVIDLRNNPGGLLDRHRGLGRFPGPGRDRVDPRAQCRGHPALEVASCQCFGRPFSHDQDPLRKSHGPKCCDAQRCFLTMCYSVILGLRRAHEAARVPYADWRCSSVAVCCPCAASSHADRWPCRPPIA